MIVSVAIVAYNEEAFLPSVLSDLCSQNYPHKKIEVLLIDSVSSDSTADIMRRFSEEDHGFLSCRFFRNEKRSIPCGHNIAIDSFIGDALIRIDAHASFPPDFISKNVDILKSGEVASGGRRPCITKRTDNFGQTLLAAEESLFGSGAASYRNGLIRQYASSLFCGMYKREVFDRVGRYNELLPRSEDNDMCHRIRKAGYKLCYDPHIVFYQYMRNTLPAMLKQKFLNGYWIGKTLGVSPGCFSLFHFAPLCFVLALILTGVFLVFGVFFPALLLWTAYLTAVLAVTVLQTVRRPLFTNLLLPPIFLLIHLFYGFGTLVGLIVMPFWLIISQKE